jgi:hypothetical protein
MLLLRSSNLPSIGWIDEAMAELPASTHAKVRKKERITNNSVYVDEDISEPLFPYRQEIR